MLNEALTWLISAVTIYALWLTGNKHPMAWAVGVGNQTLWIVWIVLSATWGLLGMSLALGALCIRNHYRWKKDAAAVVQEAEDAAIGRYFLSLATENDDVGGIWWIKWGGLTASRGRQLSARQSVLVEIEDRKQLGEFGG